jgi:hypothetical protein
MTPAEKAEAAHALRKPGDTDAVTFAWADPGAGLYGLARVATGLSADSVEQPSALVVAFSGHDPLGALAVAGEDAPDAVSATVEEPLRRWTLRGRGELEFALEFAATTPSAELGGRDKAAKAGGLEGYEQLCHVTGTVRVDGRSRAVDGLGQRGHAWGNPDWDRMSLARTLGAWLDDDLAVVMSAIRPDRAGDHEHEELSAVVLEGEPPTAVVVAEPRLSTAYDDEGRQRRAGWELWPEDEEGFARRGAGEILCGTSLDLGRLRMDCAFFRFRMEGREGVGRYDVIRRT